ncbi:MAG: cell envelope integrity protein TolA [Pseudomonadota bacterium]
MKEEPHVHAYSPRGMDIGRRTFFLNFAASTICHLIFFSILFFMPDIGPRRSFAPSVITVSLVSLPGAAPDAASSSAAAPAPKPVKKAAVPVPKPDISLSPKPSKTTVDEPKKWKPKTSLKKETFKPSKAVEEAISRIEKEAEETETAQVARAIDQLRQKVGNGTAREGSGEPGAAGAGGAGNPVLSLIDIYRIQIAFDVQKNWAFSESLAGGQGLMVELAFKVMPTGEIVDIWFDKRSGNSYLDESAQKAVMKSNPVRPHPPGIDEPYVIVGLRFTPEGVK